MLSPNVKRLTKEDAAFARGLRSIIHQGAFTMKGDAVLKAAPLFQWLDTLDKRIEETVKEPPPETIRKDLTGESDGV